MNISQKDKKRFLSKVIKTDSCWIWNAGINIWGYGNFWMNGKTHSAHRTSYIVHIGLPSDGSLILHTCDNRKCVNPEHLFLGTQAQNMTDKCNKKRQAVGEAVGGSKLKERDVLKIRELALDGYSYKDLGKQFKVDDTNISLIVRRLTWKYLP